MNLVYFIDHITKKVTINHPVNGALEDRSDNISSVSPFRSGERPQISKQPGTASPIRSNRLILINESQKFWSGYSIIFRGPITPPVGWLYSGTDALACEGRLGPQDLLLV